MAFDDSNDIKIKVTLDAQEAVDGAKAIKQQIDEIFKAGGTTFAGLSKASAEFAKVEQERIKQAGKVARDQIDAEISLNKAKERTKQTLIEENTKRKIAAINSEQALQKQSAQEQIAFIALTDAKEKAIHEAQLARLKIEKDFEAEMSRQRMKLLEQEEATRRKLESQQLKNQAPPKQVVVTQTGPSKSGQGSASVDNSILGFLKEYNAQLTSAASAWYLVSQAVSAATAPVRIFIGTIASLSEAAGKVEGLSIAFNTLQRSVGADPKQSIEQLRQATQGLVSDLDLYQKANQAVLLGVPTETFNAAAAAAVKLGRAMGIDATLGLESLSLGLGRQSRLYLDNLGIVVSATEAYRNFARENNLLASELSDSEKRAAFYAEALKKIDERASLLPDPLDSVSTAFQRVTVQGDNLSANFLKGFNDSKLLSSALIDISNILKALGPTVELVGKGFAGLLGIIIKISEAFSVVNPIFKEFLQYSNLAATFNPDTAISGIAKINEEIATQEKIVNANKKSLEDLKVTLGSFRDPQNYNARLTEVNAAQRSLDESIKKLDELKSKQQEVASLPSVTVAAKFDKTQFEQDVFDTQALIEQTLKGVRIDAGQFNLPGLNADQVEAFGTAIQDITKNLELKNLTAEKGLGLLDQEIKKYLQLAQNSQIEELIGQYNALTEQIRNTGDLSGQLAKNQGIVAENLNAAFTQSINYSRAAQGELKSFVESQIKDGKRLAAEQQKNVAKGSKDRQKLAKEIEDIIKRTNRFAKSAVPEDFSNRLLEGFRKFTPGSKEFENNLRQIEVDAQKAGVDLNALADQAKDLATQFGKGVPPLRLQISSPQGDYQKQLANIKKQTIDIRGALQKINLDFGKEGGFFGFSLGGDSSGLTPEEKKALAEQEAEAGKIIAGTIGNALSGALSAALNKDYKAAAGGIGAAVGAAIGGTIGAVLTAEIGGVGAIIGAQIGAVVGQAIGEAIYSLNGDSNATKNRKLIDKYFGELFDKERLAGVVTQQVVGGATGSIYNSLTGLQQTIAPALARFSDFVFTGMTAYNGQTFFGGPGFFDYFNTLAGDVKNTFNGVGFAIAASLGIAEEQARLVGAAIANNIGGNLETLQVLVQQTGKSFEELTQAIITGFFDGQLSIEEAYNSLVALQNVAQNGIPGAFGAVEEAANNFQLALRDGKGSRYLIDSLRDIGYETLDLKGSLGDVINTIGQSAGLTGGQIQQLFEVFRVNGINSIADFTNASNSVLITILANLQKIKDGSKDILTVPDTTGDGSQTNNDANNQSEADKKKAAKDAADRALALLRQQQQQAREYISSSAQYLAILDKIKKGQLDQIEGAKLIAELDNQTLTRIKVLANYTKEYQKLLNKPTKLLTDEELKRIGFLAGEIERIKKLLEDLQKSGEKAQKSLDLSKVIPYITDLNMLGVVSKQAGIELDKTIDILIKGFLQGRLTIKQVNDQIAGLTDKLGQGIPGKIGAVTDAFQNLIDAGRQGGSFSTDAFLDIFAEFREKFQKEGAALREAQRKTLVANLDAAQKTFNAAQDPAAAETARKALEDAKKALDEFATTVPKPDLADLRNELLRTFNPTEVDKFFQALDESGIGSFDDFAKAGSESIIKILGRLQELGFQFGTTSDDIKNVNKELQNQEKQANDNKDPLKEALDIIKQFNEGAGVLPPTFDATNKAISRLNGPLEKLASGFDGLINKLALLSGKTFENDVVFNVRTVGDDNSKALIDILFGAGDTVGKNTGSTKKTASVNESTDLVRLTRQLSTLIKRGQGNSAKASDIREQIRRLRTAG